MSKVFVAPEWRDVLKAEGLDDFESLWVRELSEVEAPNLERGGRSAVARYELPDGRELYIKRQSGHAIRTLAHPIKGLPTCQRELENIERFNKYGVPSLNAVYFDRKRIEGRDCAILITEGLSRYKSLDQYQAVWESWSSSQKQELVRSVADLLSKLHLAGMQHNCCYPQHIFVTERDDGYHARFIDLEKARYNPIKRIRQLRDVESLLRRIGYWSSADILAFVSFYLNAPQLDVRVKSFMKSIDRRIKDKRTRL